MIIYDFDFVGVALAEIEANSPAVVNRHRPLPPAVAFELVKPTLFNGLRSLSDLATFKASNRSLQPRNESAELVRQLTIPNLAAR